jgi:hypothetical protein
MHTEFVARRAVRILGVDYQPGAVIDDTSIPPGVLATLTSTRRIAQRVSDGTVVDIPIDTTGSRSLPPHPMVQPGSGPSGLYDPDHPLVARTLLVDDTVIRSGYEPLTFRSIGREEERGPNRPPYEPQEVPEGIPPPSAPPGGPAGDPAPNHQPDPPEPPSEAPEAHDARMEGIDALPWRAAWQAGVAIRSGFTGTFRAYLMARCASAGIVTSGSVTDLLARLTEVGIQPEPVVATKRPVGAGKAHGRPRKQREATP